MAQEQTAIRERQKTRLKEPGRYVVMMFNDDFTPMDFVVDILETIFFKSQASPEAHLYARIINGNLEGSEGKLERFWGAVAPRMIFTSFAIPIKKKGKE